jgi:protein TonB
MSHISIFEKRWIDLVFEGRNQAYGAYQLRQENPRTTLLALFYALLLVFSISGTIFLLSSFGPAPSPKPNETIATTVTVTGIIPPTMPPKLQSTVAAAKKDKPKDDPKPDLIHPKVVDADDHPEEVNANVDMGKTTVDATTTGPATPGMGISPGGTTPGAEKSPGEGEEKGPYISAKLDRQPMFPGGMPKFYDYVAKKFNNPDIDSGEHNIRIFVSFVIEKDGSLTEIKVMNNPGHNLDKEAIRVLKSLRTKWEPGILKGQPVRTLYTLPITLKVE